jgi:hypothetical protein
MKLKYPRRLRRQTGNVVLFCKQQKKHVFKVPAPTEQYQIHITYITGEGKCLKEASVLNRILN